MGTGRWYTIIGNNQVYTASTCQSNPPNQFEYDGQLAVYCGMNCSEFTCIGGSATLDCGPGGPGTGFYESFSWCANSGKKYFIWVGGDIIPPSAPDGVYTLVVTGSASGSCPNPLQVCGLTPANDLCANAITISNGTRTYDNTFAGTDGNANTGLPPGVNCQDSGATQTANDLWYRYVATCTGQLTVTTCSNLGGNSNYDSDLVLYPGTATCPPLGSQVISCNDDDTGNPCGSAPPWSSTLRANVTSGTSYIIRVGGWDTGDFGTGLLNVTCVAAVCGNGVIQPGEECDDGNTNNGDGCSSTCQVEAVCSTTCTQNSSETCSVGTDTVNGGCNTTPALYESITLTAGSAVLCGNLWAAPVGTTNTRDLDWYTVTVGASGTVQAHVTSSTLMPLMVFVGSASGPPATTPCTNILIQDTATITTGQCAVAVATGLTPGSTALVIVSSNNVFSGFDCTTPQTYQVRVRTP
jgi:cysteine-rich repeat protein